MIRNPTFRWASVAALGVLAVGALAVTASREPAAEPPPPTVSASPTTRPEPTVAATAPPQPSPTPGPELATAWLIDTEADRSVRLVQTMDHLGLWAFDDARGQVLVGTLKPGPDDERTLHRFDLRGNGVERGEWTLEGPFPRPCVEIRSVQAGPPAPGDPPSLVEIGGRRYEGVSCGPISPDGRWMTYWVWEEPTRTEPVHFPISQWVIEIATGERRLLQDGLVHCGGCDSVPGEEWSPTGRFVYFGDVVGGGDRFFVSDIVAGTTRQLTEHEPLEAYDMPAWSPAADVLLSTNTARLTVMEDLRTGKTTVLTDLPWPARFDPTGAFVYSPAWVNAAGTATSTTVRHVASGRVFPSMPGTTGYRSFIGTGGPAIPSNPVIGLGDGFVAALQNVPGCLGTAIYREGVNSECVARGTRPVFSPDGTKLALARATGDPVTRTMCAACFVAEIVVIDVLSGREIVPSSRSVRVVISETPFPGGGSADYSWNTAGTHLLIAGPAAG